MKKLFLLAIALPLAAGASIIVTGTPGETVTLNYTVQPDPTLWITFLTSFPLSETNPSLGFYTDVIGSLGGPVDFALPPGSSPDDDWTTTLGTYTVDPSALPSAEDDGTIRALYQRYSGDPGVCSAACFVDTQSVDVPFQVQVTSTPEPSTTLGLLLAGAELIRRRRRPV
jgi:hypothetical protein